VFTHVYPNKQNVLEHIYELEESKKINEDEADTLLQNSAIPFMFTTTQEKILKLDYQKGVINKVDITERFGLDPRTNRIRFETLPHGWDQERLRHDPATARPFSAFNIDQVIRLRDSRAESYGEGWEELQRAVEERDLLQEFL
jgi:hypothetical protein